MKKSNISLLLLLISISIALDSLDSNEPTLPDDSGLPPCLSPMDCPMVYDLVVVEEALCDGQNIVTVCYTIYDADGDNINTRFSATHADTTIVPITLTDDVPGFSGPNLGLLPSGDYCFNWNIGVDAPGMESCDFDFRIDIDNETTDILNVVDSFPITDAEGVAWDGSYLWVTRSTSVTGPDTQYVWRVDPSTHDTTLECDLMGLIDGYMADCCWQGGYLYILGGGIGGSRGKIYQLDVSTCTIVDSSEAIIPNPRWGQGIDYYEGYFYCCDSHGNIFRVDPSDWSSTLWLDVESMHPTLFDGSTTSDALVFARGYIWYLRNPGAANHVLIQMDTLGTVIDSFALASMSTYGPEGIAWDGGCFWYTDHTNNQVYRICLGGCTDSTFDNDVCLDSRDPDVTLYCPPYDSITVGENIHITWDVDDDNFMEPCSIRISGCGYDTSFTGSFSVADFDLPYAFASCPEVWIHLIARDTYCNWGSDSCMIFPRVIWNVEHRTPPEADSGYIACEDQPIIFRVDHTCPIDWTSSQLLIDGSDSYTISDIELTLGDSLLIFTPPTDYWTSGSHTYHLTLYDICGNSYDEVFDVDFDYEIPSIYGYAPVDTFSSPDSVQIGFVLQDDFSGIGDVTVTITSDCGTEIFNLIDLASTSTSLGDSFTTPNYYCEGNINICVDAEDSPYLCGPNMLHFCWDYFVPPPGEVNAELVMPIDTTGDGRVITNCSDQHIAWAIDADYEIDPATISVNICGVDYYYPDTHLLFRGDSVYWVPSTAWMPGDSCHFCLTSIEDVFGVGLDSVICGDLIYDGEPPVLVSREPAIDSIFGESALFDADFIDSICGDVIIDSIWVTTTLSRMAFRVDSFPFSVDSFIDGDDVSICAYVHDQCADYCGYNYDRICWIYDVMTGGPIGETIEPIDENGDSRIVSACTTQVIRIALYDEYGMDADRNVRLYVEELDEYFRNADLDISLAFGGDSMYIELDISDHGYDWLVYDGSFIHFTLDSAFDIYGLNIISPVHDSFIVDFSPPNITGMTPTGTVLDSVVTVTATALDDVCPIALIDSLHATVYPSSREIIIRASTGNIIGLEDGDSIHICAFAHDQCHDYCGDHHTSTCWAFGAHIGDMTAEIIYPIDENGDLRRLSTCRYQQIAWYIDHSDSMVRSEFYVEVDGSMYNYPSHLEFTNDTLYFTPSIPYSHGDTVEFCIDHMEDAIRTTEDHIGCGNFIVDLTPPVVNRFSGPFDGETITATTATGRFNAMDDYCDVEPIDSIRVTSSEGLDTLFTSDTYSLDSLIDGEIVHVCAYSNQVCQDYTCLDTTGVLCIDFDVMLGSIGATVLAPIDENSDGRIITTCADQIIMWQIGHDYPIDVATISVTVDGTVYNYPDHLDFDSDILTFTPTAEYGDGDSIAFCLNTIMDEGGAELASPLCSYFIVDLAPPIISITSGPMPLDTLYTPSLIGSVEAFDSICGFIGIDSMHITNLISGFDTSFIADSFDIDGFADGDIAEVCAWADGNCADYECFANDTMFCYEVYFSIGAISAEILMPIDLNSDGRVVSNCDDRQISWILRTEHGIDESSIRVFIDGTSYTYPDHLVLADSILTFTPTIPYLSGASIDFCLNYFTDTLGAALPMPVCSEMIVDLEPPILVSSTPMPGETIHADTVIIIANFFDEICDSLHDVESVIITSTSGISETADFYPITIRGLEDGDTVTVCTIVADECADYCAPNVDTICFDFYAAFGEPRATILAPADRNMDGRVISACDDMGIIIEFFDSHGMSNEDIHFTLNGVDYHEDDFDMLYFDPDSTRLIGEFAPATPWESGEWVTVIIDSAVNLLGDELYAPTIDSFLIDTEGPIYTYTGPIGSYMSSSAMISASAEDLICGDVINLDSMVISIAPSGIRINRGGEWVDTTLTGLADGDNVEICLFASDVCADTCGFNLSDSCISFDIVLGDIGVVVSEPIDLNGDRRVISTCVDQQIRWLITHTMPIDPTTIFAEVCGITYEVGTAELELAGDTLIWTPTVPWVDGDSCSFVLLNICDSTGTCFTDSIGGDIIIDLSPPWLTDIVPETGGFMASDTSVIFSASLFDSICPGDDFMDSLVIDIFSSGGSSHIVESDLPTGDIGWTAMESLHCCIYLSDACNDYCEANDTFYCWEYYPYTGAPIGDIVQPWDVNTDGRIISACESQGVRFIVTDPAGMSETGIGFTVNSTSYTEIDAGVSLLDTETLQIDWLPSTPWESGDIVVVNLENAENVHGINLFAPVSDTFIIDIEPPEIVYTGPSGVLYQDSAFIQIDISDEICDDDDIAIDSVIVISSLSGIHENIGSGVNNIEGVINGFIDGDIITVNAWVCDGCADTCGFNDSLAIFEFEIALGAVNAIVIPPIDTIETIISACDDQELRWFITSEVDIDETTIECAIDGDIFTISDSELSMAGDTLIFSPGSGYWASGSYDYCLSNVCNIAAECLAMPVCDSIIIDLDPPIFSMASPIGDIVNAAPEISIHISDVAAGLDATELIMTVNGDSVATEWDGAILLHQIIADFECGTDVDVCVYAADLPMICDANSADTCWRFMISCQPNITASDPAISPDGIIIEGDSVLFSGLISNNEIDDLPSFPAGVYIDGELIETVDIPAIGTGDDLNFEYVIPFLAAGSYELCLMADDGNTIDESDEYDNEICIELIISDAKCDAHPNPFTPNSDGIYDEAIFEYPGMGGVESHEIEIYDVQNRIVTTLRSGQRRWDGKDDSGKEMPKGVYIYLVRDGENVKCHGTIYIAR